jgi:hypothetical protein
VSRAFEVFVVAVLDVVTAASVSRAFGVVLVGVFATTSGPRAFVVFVVAVLDVVAAARVLRAFGVVPVAARFEAASVLRAHGSPLALSTPTERNPPNAIPQLLTTSPGVPDP